MSRMRRHDDGDHDEHPSEAWLIALADMMTLLMVTFLMMFAISNMDLEKFKVFQEAFADGTGSALPQFPGNGVPVDGEVSDIAKVTPTAVPSPSPTKAPPKNVLDKADLKKLQVEITKALAKAGLADRVEAKITSRGLVVYVTSAVLFQSGQADVTEPGKVLLDGFGPILSRIGNDLVVEGHTDARPISSRQFASNWELSGARAAAVARRLMDSSRVSTDRVSIGGYADTRPRQDAPTEEAYAKNRRVEIVVESPP